jgi:hypothetical protein
MQKHMPALAMMAPIGFCSQANAQAQCPELTRLRSEAAEASNQTRGGGLISAAAKRTFVLPGHGV